MKAPPLFAAMVPLQKMDGEVVVRGTDATATIIVTQGRVVEVVHERTSPVSVVTLLQNTGVLAPEDVALAVSRHRDIPMDRAVRVAGLVGEATLANTREFLCHEVLMDLLLRTDVAVSEPRPVRRIEREMCTMPVRFLLREAQKRATEQPAVRKVVPSDDLVFVRTPVLSAPGEARRWSDLPLSQAERQVLVFVDGERSVAEIARLSGQSCFKVARAIKTLLEMDLVRPAPPGAAKPATSRPTPAGDMARMVRIAAVALLLAALVRLGVHWAGSQAGPAEAWSAVMTRGTTRDLVQSSRIYGLLHGRPPASLEELIRDGWLGQDDAR